MSVSNSVEPKKKLSARNIIAVVSGKGGVGKSTCAINLALALAQSGRKVGVLDADIYGPSLALLCGIEEGTKPDIDGNRMNPLLSHGLEIMSVSFLIEKNAPLIWRGPIVSQVLQQMLFSTNWSDDLDFLIVDLPPGTGDIHLTLMQQVQLTGAVVITTPQQLALIDARKAIAMLGQLDVPVWGVIENMSTHICSSCGYLEAIFSNGGGQILAVENGVELLGKLPLMRYIQEDSDKGIPSMIAQDASHACKDCDCGRSSSENKEEKTSCNNENPTKNEARDVLQKTFVKIAEHIMLLANNSTDEGVEIKITDL